MHGQYLFLLSAAVGATDGFVWISKALIAESRSLSTSDWPCMGTPPVTLILVLPLEGEESRLLMFSEMSLPAAFGAGFGEDPRGNDDAGGCRPGMTVGTELKSALPAEAESEVFW